MVKNSAVIQQSYNKSFHQKCLDQVLGEKLDSSKEVGPGKYYPSLMETKITFSIKDDHRDRFGQGKLKDNLPQ